MKRFISVFVTLAVLMTMFVGLPTSAQADTPPPQITAPQPSGWPISFAGMKVNLLVALSEDKFAALNCSNPSTYTMASFVDVGEGTTRLPTSDGIQCNDNPGRDANGAMSTDGTFFTHRDTGPETHLAAYKNGRRLWSTNISSSTSCQPPYHDYDQILRSMSIGPDGNIYGILRPATSNPTCGDYLVGYDAQTGAQLFKIALTGVVYNPIVPRLWTYDDVIVLVDEAGVLREFNYEGIEDTDSDYTFSVPNGSKINNLVANSNKRVFAVMRPETNQGTVTLAFHDSGEISQESMTASYGLSYWARYGLGADGTLIALHNDSTVSRFDITNADQDTVTIPKPSGYTYGSLVGYFEDETGEGLVVRAGWNVNGSSVVSVDVVEPFTYDLANIFWLETDSGKGFNPSVYGGLLDHAFDEDYLYLPICYDVCTGDPSTDSMWVYKVELDNFGSLQRNDNAQHATYESTKLEYVAMGDSFSSGEGNGAYNPWTDRMSGSVLNKCHRSSYAYPNWFAQSSSLDLRFVDFVACSGATTNDVLGFSEIADPDGKWDEVDQLSALSENTDIVTLSIGGNDALFESFARACVLSTCDPSSDAYEVTMNIINGSLQNDLESVYRTILDQAENATLFVVGYPQIAPDVTVVGLPLPYQCEYFESNMSMVYLDAVAAREVVSSLNATIEDAVNAVRTEDEIERLFSIDPNNSIDGSFDGHDVCAGAGSYFHNVTPNDLFGNGYRPNIFHPNINGQYEYAQIVTGFIDYYME